MKSVRLIFSKNIFAVIFLKWGEQTVIEMKKKTLRKVTLEVPPCNSFVKISPATFLVNARDKSSLVLSNLLWRMVLWLITVNFENTSILFHHFLYERLFFFQYTCIYLFHVMLHINISSIFILKKKRKSRSMFSIYFDMFKLWVKLEIYHVLCYPVVL